MNASELLGEEELASEIFTHMAEETEKIFMLSGPAASGKSTIANIIRTHWNKTDSALMATSDAINRDRDLYSLYWPLQYHAKKEISRGFVTDLSKSLAKSVPILGQGVASVIEYLATKRKKTHKIETKFLSDTEQDILYYLECTAKDKNLLLICDNFQWWDKKSKELLNFILFTPNISETYPFAKNLKVLLVETDSEIKECPRQSTLGSKASKTWRTTYVNSGKYKELLTQLGLAKNVPQNIIDDIYKICSGNIDLASRVVTLLNTQKGYENRIGDSFYPDLFKIKVSNTDIEAGICEVLQSASVMGERFTDRELQCVTNETNNNLQKYLTQASSELFIVREDEYWRFMHETVRNYFAEYNKEKSIDAHYAFARCLDLLRPYDYIMRAYHYIKSKNYNTACALYICEQLKKIRLGQCPCAEFPEEYKNHNNIKHYEVALTSLTECLLEYNKNTSANIASKLHKIDVIFSQQLDVEKKYLLALCYHNSLKTDLRREALLIVENLYRDKRMTIEIEQFARISLLYILLLYDADKIMQAKNVELELVKVLSSRTEYDQTIQFQINNINTKAGLIYSPEISEIKFDSAIRYFKGSEEGVVRYPVRLFVSLTNMSSAKIVLGKYEEGLRYSSVAISLSKKYWSIKFPQVSVCLSNYLLNSFLAGKMTPADCIVACEELLSVDNELHDSALIKSNMAVFYMHAQKKEKALKCIHSIGDHFLYNENIDSYYRYFALSNLAGILWTNRDITSAQEIWDKLERVVETVGLQFHPYLTKRHMLQGTIFHKNFEGNDWDNYVANNFPDQIGLAWNFYRKGFLLSDMQIWSDE